MNLNHSITFEIGCVQYDTFNRANEAHSACFRISTGLKLKFEDWNSDLKFLHEFADSVLTLDYVRERNPLIKDFLTMIHPSAGKLLHTDCEITGSGLLIPEKYGKTIDQPSFHLLKGYMDSLTKEEEILFTMLLPHLLRNLALTGVAHWAYRSTKWENYRPITLRLVSYGMIGFDCMKLP